MNITIDWNGPDFISKNGTLSLFSDIINDRRIMGRLIRNNRRGGYRRVPKKYRELVRSMYGRA